MELTRIERNRDHERLAPIPPVSIEAEVREHPRLGMHGAGLFGSITVPRDYRVLAEAVAGNARTLLSVGLLVRGGRTYEFEIEKWPLGRREPTTQEIRFRFWPPADVDDVEHWTCPCDRPTDAGDGPGHWEWRLPVTYYDIRDSLG